MKQLQVSVPKKMKDEARDILKEYSNDLESSEVEKDGDGRRKFVKFTVTVESDQIDEVSEKFKELDGLESGDLTIRVVKQESLIRKGQQTQGSSTMLSQAEMYSQAQESAVFNRAEWSLVALSAIIATYGLIADNVIVVIGAMMVAPILSPFISAALSLNVGDKKLLVNSVKTGVLSFFVAVLAASLAALPFPVSWNSSLALVSTPSVLSVLLSVFVGAAAALTFVTGLRDEIAGVAVAIALIPPISSIGIGVKLMDLNLILNAFTVASMNIVSIIASGFVCFNIIGIKPSTYYKKKQAEEIRYVVPVAILLLVALSLPVAMSSYDSYENYKMEENIKSFGEEFFGDKLLNAEIDGSKATFYIVGEYDRVEFDTKKPEGAEIDVVQLQTAG